MEKTTDQEWRAMLKEFHELADKLTKFYSQFDERGHKNTAEPKKAVAS